MWKIDLTRIDTWLKKLSQEQRKPVFRKLIMLEQMGTELGMPNVRLLGGGLFELREMSFGYRLYFCYHKDQRRIVIVLVAGDKTSQERDIRKAREEMKS